jgi:hypothetical protein
MYPAMPYPAGLGRSDGILSRRNLHNSQFDRKDAKWAPVAPLAPLSSFGVMAQPKKNDATKRYANNFFQSVCLY